MIKIRQEIIDETCFDDDTNILFLDPPEQFDKTIIGIATIDSLPVVVYDKLAIIDSLCDDGMTYDEAIEYFDFNIDGAYLGEQTPIFVVTYVPKSV